ncbi:MAG: hypothetical protein M3O80_07510, partial [Chloroflexota bacterium]|nr:hypothetical protein [Chloroflexota bacterium]
ANTLLTLPQDSFRQGVADTLAGGIVSTVLWLLYLRAVLADTRGGEPPRYRSAGAEAQPPQELG